MPFVFLPAAYTIYRTLKISLAPPEFLLGSDLWLGYIKHLAQESIEMTGSFTIHHVGIAVPDMEQAIAFYADALGFKLVQGPFEDPVQKVKVCFLAGPEGGWGHIELITPLNEESPVNNYLKRDVGAYHVCYEVVNIAETLANLRKKGCLTISKPVPAVAFNGRKIAWCCTPTQQLVELLEKAPAA